jgi:hypothetical protein
MIEGAPGGIAGRPRAPRLARYVLDALDALRWRRSGDPRLGRLL